MLPIFNMKYRTWRQSGKDNYVTRMPPIALTPLGDPSPPKNKVYFTIFAGRKRYLSILKHYLDKLLAANVITEVHLWDYVRDPTDSDYIQSLAAANPQYVYIKPTQNMTGWNEYYKYYSEATTYAPDDIIIKCDDDIVYIDTDQMCRYLNEIKADGLYYPNIVNNDVCALMQTNYGVHNLFNDLEISRLYNTTTTPFTEWYTMCDKATGVHNMFLKDHTSFRINAPTFSWSGRISINMFGGRFSLIKEYYREFLIHGNNDDEGFLSYLLYKNINGANYIVPFMSVVHFCFNPQNTRILDNLFLEKFRRLAE